MSHALGLGACLAAFWLLLSGHYGPLLLSFGAASVILTVWIAHRMDVIDHEALPLHLGPLRVLSYWGWLFKEIAKANVDVAKVVLSPRMPISPRLVKVKATQRTDLGRVIFANSITLTPGTVSVDLIDDHILVHALTQDLADGAMNGDMDARCTRLEDRAGHSSERPGGA